jgi:hypothetical protein
MRSRARTHVTEYSDDFEDGGEEFGGAHTSGYKAPERPIIGHSESTPCGANPVIPVEQIDQPATNAPVVRLRRFARISDRPSRRDRRELLRATGRARPIRTVHQLWISLDDEQDQLPS